MSNILETIRDMALGGTHKMPNFSINLGLRIHFTDGTQTGRLLGVGLESDPSDKGSTILAHITFNGITNPGPNTLWTQAATRITNLILGNLPRSVTQWKTEWHGQEVRTS